MEKDSWMNPKVYVVILNYNGWGDTLECLESVLRSSYPNYQVVVVDNNSPDQSMHKIRAWAEGRLDVWVQADHPLRRLSYPPVSRPVEYSFFSGDEFEKAAHKVTAGPKLILIQSHENRGFAAGNNTAIRGIIKAAPDAYVWLLNPDMTVEAETLSKLVVFSMPFGSGAIVGCDIRDYKHPSKTLFYGGARLNSYSGTITFIDDFKQIDTLDYISGGSLFASARNFEASGLLPEEYFLYWEETDWCTNARGKGLKLKACAEAICYDKVSTTIGKGYVSEYYYTLNSIKFFKKYRPEQVKYILCANLLRLGKRALKLKFTNARAIVDALAFSFRA